MSSWQTQQEHRLWLQRVSSTVSGCFMPRCNARCYSAAAVVAGAKPPMYFRQNGHWHDDGAATTRSWRAQPEHRLWPQRVSSTVSGCSIHTPQSASELALFANVTSRDFIEKWRSSKLCVANSRACSHQADVTVPLQCAADAFQIGVIKE
jgi:hypothetical protein